MNIRIRKRERKDRNTIQVCVSIKEFIVCKDFDYEYEYVEKFKEEIRKRIKEKAKNVKNKLKVKNIIEDVVHFVIGRIEREECHTELLNKIKTEILKKVKELDGSDKLIGEKLLALGDAMITVNNVNCDEQLKNRYLLNHNNMLYIGEAYINDDKFMYVIWDLNEEKLKINITSINN